MKNADLSKKIHNFTSRDELDDVLKQYNDPYFVIFTDWYKAPIAFINVLHLPIGKQISYWPETLVEDLWNPVIEKIAKAVVLYPERVEAILNLREFKKNLRKHGLPLRTYVVEKEDLQIFDKENKPAKVIDPEVEERREFAKKLKEEKTRKLETQIDLYQESYDQLFSYLVFVAALFMDKTILADPKTSVPFKKADKEEQRYLFLNIMWVFMKDNHTLSRDLNIDLSIAQIKNIFAKYLWDYTKYFINDDYKVKFDDNLPNITNEKLKSLIHYYSEFLDDEILQIGIDSANVQFAEDFADSFDALKQNNQPFKFGSKNSIKVPTSKSLEKINTNNTQQNFENVVKGYTYYIKENIISFQKTGHKNRKEWNKEKKL